MKVNPRNLMIMSVFGEKVELREYRFERRSL